MVLLKLEKAYKKLIIAKFGREYLRSENGKELLNDLLSQSEEVANQHLTHNSYSFKLAPASLAKNKEGGLSVMGAATICNPDDSIAARVYAWGSSSTPKSNIVKYHESNILAAHFVEAINLYEKRKFWEAITIKPLLLGFGLIILLTHLFALPMAFKAGFESGKKESSENYKVLEQLGFVEKPTHQFVMTQYVDEKEYLYNQ